MGVDCGEEIANWLSNVIGKTVRLVFKHPDSQRVKTKKDTSSSPQSSTLALTNAAQYLLLSLESVKYLHKAITERNKENTYTEDVDSIVERFRGNLLVSGSVPFAEESWAEVTVRKSATDANGIRFHCTGLCNRCSMICVNNRTGTKTLEPLRTLGMLPPPQNSANAGRRTTFGVYLRCVFHGASIAVGDVITVTK